MRARHAFVLLFVCALALGAPASVHARSCRVATSKGPVSILILDSPRKVDEFAASVKDAPVAARDRGTVIFQDGRVVTSDVEAATRQINGLGWGARKIEIVASFRMRPAQTPGFG